MPRLPLPPARDPGGRSARLVVLGGTGDLATRHLLPAVALLADRGLVGEDLEILALGREAFTVTEYRRRVAQVLAATAPALSHHRRDALVRNLQYATLDLADPATAASALADLGPGPVVCYLALPPSLHPAAVRALASASLPGETTLVVEKPFGEDTASARALNRQVHALLPERRVFRADHFLHHQVVQDVLALRWGGGALDRLWGCEHVEAVEIVWEEAGAVTGRVELFDRLGSIKDMVQSHLLQLLAMVAMEPPQDWDEAAVRAARLAVLRAVRTPAVDRADPWLVRGRYTAGEISGAHVVGYADEPGVDPARSTETYVSLRLEVDLERWRGVPFVLRTGKAVGRPRRFVELLLRGAVGNGAAVPPAAIRIEMDPPHHAARVSLGAGAAAPDGLPELAATTLTSTEPPADLPATGRLLRDVLAGRQALFPGAEEVEECWRVTDAVLAAGGAGRTPLHDYRAGSLAPPTAF